MNFKTTKINIFIFAVIMLLFLSALVFMADLDTREKSELELNNQKMENQQVSDMNEFSFGSYLLKVALITGLIIFILIIGAKWYSKFTKQNQNNSKIKILSRHSLGPKQFMLIVGVEQKKYLIGVTEQTINLLSDMGEWNEKNEEFQYESQQDSSFSSILKSLRKEKNV